MVLTSGIHAGSLPPGVAFLPKPWQPFNVLVVAVARPGGIDVARQRLTPERCRRTIFSKSEKLVPMPPGMKVAGAFLQNHLKLGSRALEWRTLTSNKHLIYKLQ
jgi:hypothetical protein